MAVTFLAETDEDLLCVPLLTLLACRAPKLTATPFFHSYDLKQELTKSPVSRCPSGAFLCFLQTADDETDPLPPSQSS